MNDQDNIPTKPATVNLAESCGQCKYWIRESGNANSKEGLCRRFPPQHFNLPVSIEMGIALKATVLFPPMMEYNWCGEYRPLKAM